jgi:hypothetical protein
VKSGGVLVDATVDVLVELLIVVETVDVLFELLVVVCGLVSG